MKDPGELGQGGSSHPHITALHFLDTIGTRVISLPLISNVCVYMVCIHSCMYVCVCMSVCVHMRVHV